MIDASLIKHLPDSAQEELRIWESLFESPGWAQLGKVLEESFESAQAAALDADKWEDNRVATGTMRALKLVFNMPNLVEHQYEAMAYEAVEAKEAEATNREFEYE